MIEPAIDEAAAAGRDDAVGLLRDLIRAGREGEAAVQARIEAEALSLGCEVERLGFDPASVPMVEEFASRSAMTEGRRESLLGRWPGQGGRSLILFAHPDSEPIAGTEAWTLDPFAGEIRGGRIHGWGVADDLAGVATMWAALATLRRAGLAPAGEVLFASAPSKRHARGVSALLHAGRVADAAVYLHPAESGVGLREVKAFVCGQAEFRITVAGRAPDTTEPLQTAFAHLAENAIDKAMRVVGALRDLDGRRAGRLRHPVLDEAVGRSTNLMLSHIAGGESDRLARSPTRCVVAGALSFPPGERLADVCREVEAALAEAAASDPWLREHPPELEWLSGTGAAAIAADDPLYLATADAIRAVTGEPPHVNPLHTGSDIRNPILQKGIPTVGIGPLCGDLSQNGGRDEWVDLDDYLRTIRVLARLVAAWCGTVSARP